MSFVKCTAQHGRHINNATITKQQPAKVDVALFCQCGNKENKVATLVKIVWNENTT